MRSLGLMSPARSWPALRQPFGTEQSRGPACTLPPPLAKTYDESNLLPSRARHLVEFSCLLSKDPRSGGPYPGPPGWWCLEKALAP